MGIKVDERIEVNSAMKEDQEEYKKQMTRNIQERPETGFQEILKRMKTEEIRINRIQLE